MALLTLLYHSNMMANNTEYKLKTALIYKLAKFVEWPSVDTQGFGICVLGENNLAKVAKALEQRKIKGVAVIVYPFQQSSSIRNNCQILYIAHTKQPFIDTILQQIQSKPILTISDMPQFAQQGGMIQLSLINKTIRFKINLSQVKASNLQIASPLLSIAEIISP